MKNLKQVVGELGGLQGDVGLVRVPDEIAAQIAAKVKPRKGKDAKILARGEVTGHDHRLTGDVVTFDGTDELVGLLFAKVASKATLVHGGADPKTDFDHYQQEYGKGWYVYLPQLTEENQPMLD